MRCASNPAGSALAFKACAAREKPAAQRHDPPHFSHHPQVEDDPLGRGQKSVHGSMYRDLRTNLPREVRPVTSSVSPAALPSNNASANT